MFIDNTYSHSLPRLRFFYAAVLTKSAEHLAGIFQSFESISVLNVTVEFVG